MTGQSQKSKRKNLFGFERPCSYPRFVLFGNFLENALDAARRATHTPRASLPRTPTNLPSFPQSLADPYLNLPHRRLHPHTRTRNQRKYGRDATLAQHRQLRALARRSPRRTVRPFEIATLPDPAFDRVSSRVLAGPPRREREYASRRDERTPPNLTREIPPRRCVETLESFLP